MCFQIFCIEEETLKEVEMLICILKRLHFSTMGTRLKQLLGLDPHPQLLHIDRFHSSVVYLTMANMCVVLTWIYILHYRCSVIEQKLGPLLKDLINALSGRLLNSCYTLHLIWLLKIFVKQILLFFFQLLVSDLAT